MAEASKDQDQSMEDILQSIKRIIADEGEASPTLPGSDVLELTELLAEDVAVVPPPPPPPPAPEPTPVVMAEEAVEVGTMSIEEIMAAPVSAMPQHPVEPPPPAPAPAAPVFQPAPVTTVAAAPRSDFEKLLSDATVAASAAAFQTLAQSPAAHHHAPMTNPVFRSGTTVEDLAIEAMKPMLKEWLDTNLPSMVRTLVEKEIRRITG